MKKLFILNIIFFICLIATPSFAFNVYGEAWKLENHIIKPGDGTQGIEFTNFSTIRLNGLMVGFRNLSSTSETITTADYLITCLANDNGVTLNLPPVSTKSQIIKVKYVDSGSTNKCYLDGNASEQVEGFDVYSGLDTFREGRILESDPARASWWITGGWQ